MGERVELDDGTVVWIRSVVPADREQIAAGLAVLSDESRRRRFFTSLPALTEGELDYLTCPDQASHVAIRAECDVDGHRTGVAIGRYVRIADEPDAAEVAITVLDEYQGRGIGTLLLRTLAELAAEVGIRRFVTYVLWENDVMIDLLVANGGRVRPDEPGVARIELDLPDGRPVRPTTTGLRRRRRGR